MCTKSQTFWATNRQKAQSENFKWNYEIKMD